MKWIKLSDKLPPITKQIVLLSNKGSIKLARRASKEHADEVNNIIKELLSGLIKRGNHINTAYDENGLPLIRTENEVWEYWCLLPVKPLKQKELEDKPCAPDKQEK